jgi:hypothetical protein
MMARGIPMNGSVDCAAQALCSSNGPNIIVIVVILVVFVVIAVFIVTFNPSKKNKIPTIFENVETAIRLGKATTGTDPAAALKDIDTALTRNLGPIYTDFAAGPLGDALRAFHKFNNTVHTVGHPQVEQKKICDIRKCHKLTIGGGGGSIVITDMNSVGAPVVHPISASPITISPLPPPGGFGGAPGTVVIRVDPAPCIPKCLPESDYEFLCDCGQSSICRNADKPPFASKCAPRDMTVPEFIAATGKIIDGLEKQWKKPAVTAALEKIVKLLT